MEKNNRNPANHGVSSVTPGSIILENPNADIDTKCEQAFTTRIFFLPESISFFPEIPYIDMSHFAYACKMRYPLNLVLESWKYLWFY